MEKKEEVKVKTGRKPIKKDIKEDKKDIKDNKKNIKKYIIIAVVMLLVICLGSFIGYKYYDSHKSVGSDWGDTYFEFIKNSKDDSKVNFEDNSKFGFIQVPKVSEPVMVVNYKKDDVKHSDIYFLNDKEVSNVIDLGLNDVKLLYNIEKKEYNWYGYTKTEDEDKYVLLSDKIEEKEEALEYTFKENEEISTDTVSGEKLSISKFDTVFIDTNVEIKDVEFSEKMTDEELKEVVGEAVNDYKETDKITTKEVKKDVTAKEKEVVKKQEDIKNAAEELQKKQEEDRKRAEEEAKKGYKVGSFTLKYGTYKSEYDGDYIQNSGRYTIKNDGTYTYIKPNYRRYDSDSRQWVEVPGGVQESGTYKGMTTINGIDEEHGVKVLSICFFPTQSNVKQYLTYGNGESEECFEVKENNSWDGVQYPNRYTFIG